MGGQVGQDKLHLAVPPPGLFENGKGRAHGGGGLRHPLPTFGIGADEQGPFDILANPSGEQRRGPDHAGGDRVELVKRSKPVQVGVGGYQPIHAGGEHAGEAAGSNRFARLEAAILPHIGQVGRNEANPRRAKVSGRVGGEQQRGQLRIGIGQRAIEHDLGARKARRQPQIGLVVRKAAGCDHGMIAAQRPGKPLAEGLSFGPGQDEAPPAHSATVKIAPSAAA